MESCRKRSQQQIQCAKHIVNDYTGKIVNLVTAQKRAGASTHSVSCDGIVVALIVHKQTVLQKDALKAANHRQLFIGIYSGAFTSSQTSRSEKSSSGEVRCKRLLFTSLREEMIFS